MQKGYNKLRLRRAQFILSIVTITAASVVYVHQQTELVKLSYAIEEKEKRVKEMLDHKEILGYNVLNLEDPSRLEKVLLAKKVEVEFPKKNQIVRLANIPVDMNARTRVTSAVVEKKTNAFGIFELLGLRSEAQAKEK